MHSTYKSNLLMLMLLVPSTQIYKHALILFCNIFILFILGNSTHKQTTQQNNRLTITIFNSFYSSFATFFFCFLVIFFYNQNGIYVRLLREEPKKYHTCENICVLSTKHKCTVTSLKTFFPSVLMKL